MLHLFDGGLVFGPFSTPTCRRHCVLPAPGACCKRVAVEVGGVVAALLPSAEDTACFPPLVPVVSVSLLRLGVLSQLLCAQCGTQNQKTAPICASGARLGRSDTCFVYPPCSFWAQATGCESKLGRQRRATAIFPGGIFGPSSRHANDVRLSPTNACFNPLLFHNDFAAPTPAEVSRPPPAASPCRARPNDFAAPRPTPRGTVLHQTNSWSA